MRFPDDMNIIVFLLACYDYPIADIRSYDKSCGAINHPISATCLLDRQSDQGNVSMHHQGNVIIINCCHRGFNQFPILYIDRHKARSPRKHKYPLFSLTGEEENTQRRHKTTHKLTTYILNPIQYHLETLSVFGC